MWQRGIYLSLGLNGKKQRTIDIKLPKQGILSNNAGGLTKPATDNGQTSFLSFKIDWGKNSGGNFFQYNQTYNLIST